MREGVGVGSATRRVRSPPIALWSTGLTFGVGIGLCGQRCGGWIFNNFVLYFRI